MVYARFVNDARNLPDQLVQCLVFVSILPQRLMDKGSQLVRAHVLKVRKLARLADFLPLNKHTELFAEQLASPINSSAVVPVLASWLASRIQYRTLL